MNDGLCTALVVLTVFLVALPASAQDENGIPEIGISDIIELLGSEDIEDRRCGAMIAWEHGAAAVPHLIRALSDPDLQVQQNAAWSLGQIGAPSASAVKPLVRRIKSCPVADGGNFIQALVRLSAVAPEADVAASRMLHDGRRELRREFLFHIHTDQGAAPGVVAELVTLAFDADEDLAICAQMALTTSGSRGTLAVPMLRSQVEAGDVERQVVAVRLLAELVRKTPHALPVVITYLGHEEPRVRREALSRYLISPERCRGETVSLIQAMKGSDWRLRVGLMSALFCIGPHAMETLGKVHALFDSPHAANAAFAIGVLSCRDKETVRLLQNAVGSEDPVLGALSGYALWILTGEAEGVAKALTAVLDPASPNKTVVNALRMMGSLAAAAGPKVTTMLAHEDESTREQARETLASIESEEAADLLRSRANSPVTVERFLPPYTGRTPKGAPGVACRC